MNAPGHPILEGEIILQLLSNQSTLVSVLLIFVRPGKLYITLIHGSTPKRNKYKQKLLVRGVIAHSGVCMGYTPNPKAQMLSMFFFFFKSWVYSKEL